jgi:hypothetical protein
MLAYLRTAGAVQPADGKRIKKLCEMLVSRNPLPRYEATIRFFKRQTTVAPDSPERIEVPADMLLACAAALKKSHYGYFKDDDKFRVFWCKIMKEVPDMSWPVLVDWAQQNVDQ